MPPHILCLETSAAKCSVAVSLSDDVVIYREADEDYSHVSLITSLIREVLAKAKLDFGSLDAVAISEGPGSYTGLRVGASTAKGICFGADIPMIAVSTLDIVANALCKIHSKHRNTCYISTIDARRDEVYMAMYNQDLIRISEPEAYILTKESFMTEQQKFDQVILGGDAATKAKGIIAIQDYIFEEIQPDAKHLVPLAKAAFQNANFVELSSYKPFYLKPPNITVSKKQFFRKN